MNKKRREELRAMAMAATPGPWTHELDMFTDCVIAASVSDGPVNMLAILDTDFRSVKEDRDCGDEQTPWTAEDEAFNNESWRKAYESQQLKDAAFIAIARTALPEALDAIDALESKTDALVEFLDHFIATGSGWIDVIHAAARARKENR